MKPPDRGVVVQADKKPLTRLLIWLRRFIAGLIVLISLGACLAFIHVEWFLPYLDGRLEKLHNYKPPVICNIYDRHGQIIDTLYDERRVWAPLSQISKPMQEAVLAAEDRRFFDHPGFDGKAMVRAFLANIEALNYAQGASTLTQQLVKHIIVGQERSLRRKFEEVLLAWRLEQRVDKKELFELYLNYIYLGEGNYGVEAAAQDYFNKSAADLNYAEAALLAGLIPSPSTTSPRKNHWGALERREVVLRNLVEAGYLTPLDLYHVRRDYGIQAHLTPSAKRVGDAYRSEVRRTLSALAPRAVLFENGLQIHTPYDPELQSIVEDAIQKGIADIEKRQGHGGPREILDEGGWLLFFQRGQGLKHHAITQAVEKPENGSCFPAVFKKDGDSKVYAGNWDFSLSKGAKNTKIRSASAKRKSQPLYRAAKRGHVYDICLNDKGLADLAPHPWVEAAAVIMHTPTGEIRAITGGRNMPLAGFNRASQGKRQPGSAFKPIVFAAALDDGKHQLHKVLDGPLTLKSGGQVWSPQNYDRWFRGWVTLRYALSHSLNTATVRLSQELGLQKILHMAGNFGLDSGLREDITLPLGTSELTLLDLTTAFSLLDRQGFYQAPIFVKTIQNHHLQTIGEAGGIANLGGHIRMPGLRPKAAISPQNAYQLLNILESVVRSGTAKSSAKRGYARAGKTGTSSDYADAWFVGMVPEYTVGVWVGSDKRSPLGPGESGGKAALPIWESIVEHLETKKGARFTIPNGIRFINWGHDPIALPKK